MFAAVVVWAARSLLSSDWGQSFVARYDGNAPQPDNAPVGIPRWLTWSHFFNMFFMALIVSTGWRIRTEARPPAVWRSKSDSNVAISVTTWMHLAIDALWIINGVIYIVLLFLTGQWMRIVPTSWDVFPHALSALLQYLTLNWPLSNGWVNYNALQQLFYFAVVFIAAPLAILSGLRLSPLWSKKWSRINTLYKTSYARNLHVYTMVFFIVFVVVHVVLVIGTGALRNLNAMIAGQGSTDPHAFADNWTGFWLLVLVLAVIALAIRLVANPNIVVAFARRTGDVRGR